MSELPLKVAEGDEIASATFWPAGKLKIPEAKKKASQAFLMQLIVIHPNFAQRVSGW